MTRKLGAIGTFHNVHCLDSVFRMFSEKAIRRALSSEYGTRTELMRWRMICLKWAIHTYTSRFGQAYVVRAVTSLYIIIAIYLWRKDVPTAPYSS